MASHASNLLPSVAPRIPDTERRIPIRRLFLAATAIALAGTAIVLGTELSQHRPGSVSTASSTHLTVTGEGAWLTRHVWHLTCNPPSGNVPQPAQACAAIAAHPNLIAAPKPYACYGGENVTIVGRMNDKPVRTTFATCASPLISLLQGNPLASSSAHSDSRPPG